MDYGDVEQTYAAVNTGKIQKTLTLYEMDLGLNNVTRKHIWAVDSTAHKLIPVPGENGPSGILVVCEDFVVYMNVNHEPRKCYFPKRKLPPTLRDPSGLFITSHSTFTGAQFFFILQSEFGDLYKVNLDTTE
jgi:splicing factor 3B subunit 3